LACCERAHLAVFAMLADWVPAIVISMARGWRGTCNRAGRGCMHVLTSSGRFGARRREMASADMGRHGQTWTDMGRHGQLILKRCTGRNVFGFFGIFYKSGAPPSHCATTSCVLNGARATTRWRDDVTDCQIGTGCQEGLNVLHVGP